MYHCKNNDPKRKGFCWAMFNAWNMAVFFPSEALKPLIICEWLYPSNSVDIHFG